MKIEVRSTGNFHVIVDGCAIGEQLIKVEAEIVQSWLNSLDNDEKDILARALRPVRKD